MNLNIAGAVTHFDELIVNILKVRSKNKDINFTVYDGPNLCRWNGGRVNRDIVLEPRMIEMYNKLGIKVALTFTNPIIELDDKVGNELLELLNFYGKKYNIRNKIILVNDELRKYIRNRYDFTLVYSVTGHPSDVEITEGLINRYLELETKYDMIVPKFEVVFEEKWYSRVDRSKYELLTNDTCSYACPYFREHFEAIANLNRVSNKPWEEVGFKQCFDTEECFIPEFDPDKGSPEQIEEYGPKLGMDYNDEMYSRALDLGFTSFKLAGRENTSDHLLDDIRKFLRDIR